MSAVFALDRVPSLSRATVVRDELLRVDAERVTAGWADARVLRVDPGGRVAARDGALVLEPAPSTGTGPGRDAVLLGEDGDTAVWAVPTPVLEVLEGEQPVDLRSGGSLLDDTGAGLLTTATALLAWHGMARYCAVCGSRTTPESCGWARRCSQCGRDEYPRTDPAVICLVHDGDEQVLLGRQPSWPVGRFSVLAGFVEAGESLEACVEREVLEEVGVVVTDISYLGSQPWPFPRSLMLGFEATADASLRVVPREGEIAEAHWFTKNQVRQALARGEWTGHANDPGSEVPLLLPGSISIARVMLESWVG